MMVGDRDRKQPLDEAVARDQYGPTARPKWRAYRNTLHLSENVRLVFLPPYYPELNPIKRVWCDLKDDLTWEQFTDVASQHEAVAELLRAYDAPTNHAPAIRT